MKQTLTTGQIIDALMRDQNAGWSYDAARALALDLESIEEETGVEMELDVVAIRCEWNEYNSHVEIAEDYDIDIEGQDEDEARQTVEEYVAARSRIISIGSGAYVVQAF